MRPLLLDAFCGEGGAGAGYAMAGFEVIGVDTSAQRLEPHPKHDLTVQVAGAYSGARRDKREAREVRHGGYVPRSLDVLRALLGTPWMSEQGCFLSIPPVYTEHIGSQLMAHVGERVA